jgi:uncharacterized protein YdeI (YjbR/CyaY-like superfamily)
MELKDGIESFYAKDRAAWRQWLLKNHETAKAIWLIIYKKESKTPSVYYPEAVDEALCFGWVDSKPNKRDDESYYQYFAKRNPKSNWSKINKNKVTTLIKAGLMHESGLVSIALAKKTGTWNALDKVDNLVLPEAMQQLFNKNNKAFQYWEAFPPSTKRGILEWIYNAKQESTMLKRIEETVQLATENKRANQYIKK